MVRRAERIQPKRYEDILDLPPLRTANLFDPHSKILPEQARRLKDYDLYAGGYAKSRRGSNNLQTVLQKLGNRDVVDGVIWDLGGDEYAIIQQKNSGATGTEFFFAQIVSAPSSWTQIQTLTAANLTIADLEPADMFISGDRLYVFHGLGNYVIQWSGSAFVARPMGLEGPRISSLASGGAGNMTGLYTLGVELVYQVDGVDIVNSTPWRKTAAGSLLSITLDGESCNVTVDSAELPASPGDYWTHARVWMSRNQNVDRSDPGNPKDASGLPSELYPAKLVAKADLVAASYVINVNLTDDDLPGDTTSDYPVLDIRYIELSPLPAANVGAYHRDRIWASPAARPTRIAYTQSAGDAYAEQYNPLSEVKAEPGDAQNVIRILSFERDLIVVKEAKTGRILDGDPDQGMETLDHTIGVTHRKLVKYVPKVGICAVTNDQGEFKVFGYDLRWRNIVNDIDLSRAIRNETAAMTGESASFLYINGKLMIFDGTNTPYVYHAKEGQGWTTYEYAVATAQLALPFANGTRACIVSKNAYVVEIEVDGLDTDVDTTSDAATIIEPEFTTSMYKKRGGRDILEFRWYSVVAKLSNNLRAIPYVNGKSWPEPDVQNETRFTPPASAYDAGDARLEREYRLYLDSPRPVGQFQHFLIKSVAPCTIHEQALGCFVDEVGMGAGQFDPFAQLTDAEATPDWIDTTELDAQEGARDLGEMDELDAVEGVRDTSTMTELDRDA